MAEDIDFSIVLDDDSSSTQVKSDAQSRNNLFATKNIRPSPEDEKARQEALKQELASVKKVNEAIEGVLQSLERAKSNVKVRC